MPSIKTIKALLFIAINMLAITMFEIVAAPIKDETRNVILIIGDGMDDHQISIARNYLHGAKGKLTLDMLSHRSAVQVLATSDTTPSKAVYVADSANSATSIATGEISSRGRISTSAKTDKDLETIVEIANRHHYKTGIVTTASITDATPASFVAHISSRNCENPSMMVNALYYDRVLVNCQKDLKSNRGLGSISEQIADSDIDIILGGGKKHFDIRIENSEQTVLDSAKSNGFHVITSKEELQSIKTQNKVLGLFSPSTLPIKLIGEGGRIAEKPKPSFLNFFHRYIGSVELPEPMSCENNPLFENSPSLALMTKVAINQLASSNSKGFFLVVESALIDKQSHERNPCGHIGEVAQLEESLKVALEFAKQHKNTLILVTADHGQAAQMVPDESLFSAFDVPVFTPGQLARVKTPEGSVMAINYATNQFNLEEHTGVNVPLFANDVGIGLLPTTLHQPQIFNIMLQYLDIADQN